MVSQTRSVRGGLTMATLKEQRVGDYRAYPRYYLVSLLEKRPSRRVWPTSDTYGSSYGLPCWVDAQETNYGQANLGAPLGFDLVIREANHE